MTYTQTAQNAAAIYRASPAPLMLAIETSCDETAASVLQNGVNALSMSVHSQIGIHRKYGGVVPEIASRSHVERIGAVVDDALTAANVTLDDIGAISVTYAPGLVGALLVGLSYAKGLALAKGLPLVGVNHIAGHIAANYLTHPRLKPPFVCLIASGGHSHIVLVKGYNEFALLGRTRDDAAGEAFDKVARTLSLPYPGGPELEALAKHGDPYAYSFSAPFNAGASLEFSFSGMKTAVINLLHTAKQRNETLNYADVAASFQRAVVETLAEKSLAATKAANATTLALAGGVSANAALREAMATGAKKRGIDFYAPDMRFCTDNAAMIGCAGHHAIMAGITHGMELNGDPAGSLVNM